MKGHKTLVKHRSNTDESMTNSTVITAPKAATQPTPPPKPSVNGTSGNVTKETNVAGNPKLEGVQIDKAPYVLTNCDQVLLFPGKRIFPENDYTKKIPAYFTMSAYLVNVFTQKNSSDLLQSVAVANMNTMPTVLQGSKDCMFFADNVTFRSFTMCLEEPVLSQIQKAFQQFYNCRNGYGFNSNPDVNSLMKALCNTNKTAPNYTALRKKFKNEMTKVGVNKFLLLKLIYIFSLL